MYQQIDGVARSSPLDSVFVFCGILQKITFQKKLLSLIFILDMLVRLLLFSVMKRNAINFFRNLILYTHIWFLLTKKKLTSYCRFLMCWLKSLTKSLLF